MSRVDEALERAAALAGTQPGTSLTPGRDFEPASSADLWPSEGVVEEAAPPAPPIPVIQHFTASDVPTEADEKLVSRLLDSRSVEQYRQIAARLHLSQAQHGIRVVMISSALPGEGKTLTAANVALTLSQSYKRRVLLIDGDLRRPWMHELFGVPNVTGLNDGFRTQAAQKVPLIRWSEYLTLLTAGRPDPDPMAVLASDRMKQIVSEASATFDWVIIDTPPVGLLSDANLLSAMVDAVIMVIQSGRTPFLDIQKAVQTLGAKSIFGVVLNRVEAKHQTSRDDYYYSYAAKPIAE